MERLRFFRDYLIERFGRALQRIPLDPGFSCPNRRRDHSGGCAFCSARGGRAVHLQENLSLEAQVERGREYVLERYGSAGPYIAYFQAFTGTNAPVSVLRATYERVLAAADFPMLCIGTRPDSLDDACLDYLAELAEQREVWVELGIQTANDRTLELVRRGHDFACSAAAAEKLAARGIHTAAHLMIGLPGETADDWNATARAVAALPVEGVKYHQTLVLRGTPLAAMYAAGRVRPLNEYEYADALASALRLLPENTLLMRLSAEAGADEEIAPRWWMDKSRFLEMFQQKFLHPEAESKFTPCCTADGTYTLYHPQYRQHFHSLAGAWEESEKKYLQPANLRPRLEKGENLRVLDVGFGLGCNAASAVSLAEKIACGKLEIVSLEADPNVLSAALSLPAGPARKILTDLAEHGRYVSPFADLRLLFGDARATLSALSPAGPFDAIFLDGFSPDVNPELWTADWIALLAENLAEDGELATYSSAYPLFGALLEAGLEIRRSEPFGRRRPGTAAVKSGRELPGLAGLSEKDRAIVTRSTAGVPYRDPGLTHTREEIFALRREEVARLRASGMPKWAKF